MSVDNAKFQVLYLPTQREW